MRLKIAAVAAAAVGLATGFSSAATVISTGVAGWKFKQFDPFAQTNTGSALYTTTEAAEGSAAVSIAGNGAWVTPASVGSTAGLSWISALSNGASAGLYGLYTYELTLALTPGTYEISGKFTSDNLVDSFKINGTELLTGYVGPTETSYNTVFTVPSGSGASPVTLTVRVYNESTKADQLGPYGNYPVGPNPVDSTTNPTGFILDGEAVAVPLPAAVWAGSALLGGLIVARRRQSTAV